MAAGGGQKRGGGGRGWGIWGSPRRTGAEDVCGRGAAWAATGAPVKTSEFSATWAFHKRPHFTEETADRLKLRIRDSIERTHAALTVSWTVSLSPERLREHQAHLLSSSQLHRVYRPLQRALALPRREPLCSPPPAWMGPLSLPPQARTDFSYWVILLIFNLKREGFTISIQDMESEVQKRLVSQISQLLIICNY